MPRKSAVAPVESAPTKAKAKARTPKVQPEPVALLPPIATDNKVRISADILAIAAEKAQLLGLPRRAALEGMARSAAPFYGLGPHVLLSATEMGEIQSLLSQALSLSPGLHKSAKLAIRSASDRLEAAPRV